MIEPGTLVAERYRLAERIAVERFGEAWRADDTVLNRTLTVWCRLQSLSIPQGFEERFRPNVRAVATVSHPRLVHIIDFGSEPSVGLFVVTEHPEAQPLSQLLARVGRLPADQALTILADAADGLQAMHSAGFAHGYVMPATILVGSDGGALLAGIYLSALGREPVPSGPTHYISPEEAKGEQISLLTDIYALGLVGYACLAGRPPFEHEHPLHVAVMHVREQPPPLPSDIPGPVRAVVARALAKDPADRWLSASALATAARDLTG